MNICFYHSSFTQGGIGRSVSLIGNELAKNPKYHIFALCHSNVEKEDIYQTDFEVTYLYERRTPVSKAMLRDHYVKKVAAYLREKKIDLLVVCGDLYAPAAVLAAKDIPVLFWFHTSPYVDSDYRFQKLGRRIGFSKSNGIIAVTKKTKSIIQKRFPKQNIYCVYNIADEKLFDIQKPYDPDTKKIISAGRLSYPKNFQNMIKIAAQLREQLPELEWVIYGEGGERADLERLIAEYHLEDVFHLMGQSSELYEKYYESSAYISTSRYEGFPMTLIEASACGLPMISYDILTGPSEIIENGENGFLCPEGDIEEMKRSIVKLFSDREMRLRMSENCRKTAQQFKADRIVAQWEALIKDYEKKV